MQVFLLYCIYIDRGVTAKLLSHNLFALQIPLQVDLYEITAHHWQLSIVVFTQEFLEALLPKNPHTSEQYNRKTCTTASGLLNSHLPPKVHGICHVNAPIHEPKAISWRNLHSNSVCVCVCVCVCVGGGGGGGGGGSRNNNFSQKFHLTDVY